MSGYNADDGLIFADPSVQNTTAVNAYVKTQLLTNAAPEIIDYVINTLYPPLFDNKTALGYNDTTSRLSTLIGDLLLNCNVQALLEAFRASHDTSQSYAYLFHEGPSLYGEEDAYTFYTYGRKRTDTYGYPANRTVAKTLQDQTITFSATENPNRPNSTPIQPYGSGPIMSLLSNKAVGTPVKDPAGGERCAFWQKALYY